MAMIICRYSDCPACHAQPDGQTTVSGYTPVVGDAWLLVDGFVRATWRIERTDRAAVLRIAAFEPISGRDRTAVTGEGKRLLALAAPDANRRDVRFA